MLVSGIKFSVVKWVSTRGSIKKRKSLWQRHEKQTETISNNLQVSKKNFIYFVHIKRSI